MPSRNFVITYNNPKEDIHQLLERIKAYGFTYGRAQLERGESGTLHIQATFGGKQCKPTMLHKLLPGVHVEVARNALASWDYCGKEESRVEGPVEFGVPPARLNVAGDK